MGKIFSGAEIEEPLFSMAEGNVMGFALYYNLGGQIDVLEVEKAVKRGMHIMFIGKNLSDAVARDFVLTGAAVNLIDFETTSNRMYNLIRDNIHVHSFLRNGSCGQVEDLKKTESNARKKGAHGTARVYVLGRYEPVHISRFDKKGRALMKGYGRRDDIIRAGGIPVDTERLGKAGSGSSIVDYALR